MNAFPEIRKSLLKLHPFTTEQIELFTHSLQFSNLNKGEFILKEKQVSDKLIFVLSGSLRFFTQNKVEDLTLNFVTAHSWFGDIESLLRQIPSENYIEAAEASYIATIKMTSIHKLMDLHPSFHMLYGLLSNLTISSKYVDTVTNKNPDDRYQELLATHPDWIVRYPQKQIASYLRITPETLSRVRARIR